MSAKNHIYALSFLALSIDYPSKKQLKLHLNPSKLVLHEQFLIWICRTNNTPLSHLLSFRHTTINTPEDPLYSCRWNQEAKLQEMLYIEQITCSTLLISLLMSLDDMVQPYCEKRRKQFDASFTVTHQLRCDPHVCSRNNMWEQSFITETRG